MLLKFCLKKVKGKTECLGGEIYNGKVPVFPRILPVLAIFLLSQICYLNNDGDKLEKRLW